MGKKKTDKELEELEEMEEDEKVEENDSSSNSTSTESKEKSFKDIVIETTGRIVDRYIEMVKSKGTDDAFLRGLENENKKKEECINYVMNNLTEQRIFGGDDSLMYPYIHDYYVDALLKDEQVKDNWSNHIRNTPAPSKGGAKAQAKEDAKNKITEEQKQKFYEEALEEAKREAKIKAEEKIKEQERIRKEKEKELAEKKKAEELAKKEAEKIAKEKAKEDALKNGAAKQMSLFDL